MALLWLVRVREAMTCIIILYQWVCLELHCLLADSGRHLDILKMVLSLAQISIDERVMQETRHTSSVRATKKRLRALFKSKMNMDEQQRETSIFSAAVFGNSRT